MKVLKNANVKNFKVDTTFYTINEMYTMLDNGIVDRPLKDIEDRDGIIYSEISKIYFCVYSDSCKEVKVIYNKDSEQYETVVITETGLTIHVVI